MATVSFTDNVDDVISDIEDVKEDTYKEFGKRIWRVMGLLLERAKQYVLQDADYRGDLHRSLHRSRDATIGGYQFKVATDASIAPHAAIAELGSGKKSLQPWEDSAQTYPPSSKPPGFPYNGPSVDYDPDSTYELEDGTDFSELVGVIYEWMEEKPVKPETGSVMESSFLIAREIAANGTHSHPYMRPAWFDTVLQVRKAAKNALKNTTR